MLYSKVLGQAEHVVLQEAKQFGRMESSAIAGLFVRLSTTSRSVLQGSLVWKLSSRTCVPS